MSKLNYMATLFHPDVEELCAAAPRDRDEPVERVEVRVNRLEVGGDGFDEAGVREFLRLAKK